MICEKPSEQAKAASFLTDSIVIDTDTLSDLNVDIDLSNYKKVNGDILSKDNISDDTGKEYVLSPKEEVDSLVSALYKKDQSLMTQEILDLIDSDFFEISSKMGNKSFRVSPGLYIQLVNKCFTKDLTLANVVRDRFKDEILDFISQLEDEVELESEKKKFITKELDDWVKSDSSRDVYNLPISIPTDIDDYEELIQGEYILGKHYFSNKIRESLDEDAYEVFKEKVLSKLDFKFSKNRWPFLDQVKNADSHFTLRYEDGNTYVTYPRLLILRGDWKSQESFKQYIDKLDHGKEILSAINENRADIYPHQSEHCHQESCSHDECIEIDTPILANTIIRSKVSFDENRNLLISGIPLEDENFIDRFIEAKKETVKEDLFGSESVKKEDLQKKVEKAINNGETSKARRINEKIVLLENLEDYFYVIASLFSKIEKQVITINGLKDILQLVDAVKESKGLEEILQEG